jgi:hypothetical protein
MWAYPTSTIYHSFEGTASPDKVTDGEGTTSYGERSGHRPTTAWPEERDQRREATPK